MTQRERQATGGPATPPPIAERPSHAAPAARPADAALLGSLAVPFLSPAQQQALVALAAEQGVVNARQIPAPNGAADLARLFFSPLFHGQGLDRLSPFQFATIDPVDKALTEEQRIAVAKAIHSPDVCLICGLPGTGKSRVIAEIARQAAR